MAKKTSANIGFEKQIWDAACELWGHIPAADYRKVIVGLIFLRYIGSAFEKRFEELVREGDGFENDPDAYEEDNIFFVPEAARWAKIAAEAHTPEIGTVIDVARWKYGTPPAGNANYAWMQHMIHHLAPNGKIGLVLANGALSTQSGGEGEIRKRIIEDDLVEGVIALRRSFFTA